MAGTTWNLAISAAFLAGACALGAAPAGAQSGAPQLVPARADPFSALVGKREDRRAERQRARGVERYAVAGDTRFFLLEGRVGDARIKFLCGEDDPRLDCQVDPEGPAEEIIALTGVRGSRGEVTFRDQLGDVVLRLTSYGGATVFWPGDRRGQPAAKSYGDDGALQLPEADRAAAHRRARFATAHLSALTGEPIVFDIGRRSGAPASAPLAFAAAAEGVASQAAARRARAEAAADPEAEAEVDSDDPSADDTGAAAGGPGGREASVLADAVARVAGGMQQVADDPTGARYLGARVKTVRFRPGAGPSISLENGVLTVVYDPLGDLAGRPSSAAVARFLEETL